MAFNVEKFRSNIAKNGLIQTNKYDINMSFGLDSNQQSPQNFTITTNGQSANFTDILAYLSNRCVSASLPGVALRTIDSNRYGLGIIEKMPYTGNYTDISLTFLCDRLGFTYNFWYSWINYIFAVNGHDSNGTVDKTSGTRPYYTTQYKDSYAGNLKITVYDQGGNPSLVYSLYKAYPISINDTAVSWSDNNDLLKLTTTITFREWSFEGTTLNGNGGGSSNLLI